MVLDCVAQSVMCLATDANLTANPEVASSISARSHTFVEIDDETMKWPFSYNSFVKLSLYNPIHI